MMSLRIQPRVYECKQKVVLEGALLITMHHSPHLARDIARDGLFAVGVFCCVGIRLRLFITAAPLV